MQVEVSGRTFDFPPYCTCCGNPPHTALTAAATRTRGKKVVHTETHTWDFPYCSQCAEHVKTAKDAGSTAAGLVLLALLASPFLAIWVWRPLGVLATIGGIIAAGCAYNQLMTKARSLMVPNCSCLEMAVSFQGWHGTHQRFFFRSQGYAIAFMLANRTKLVNLTPEAQQILHAHGADPVNRGQSSKRYMT